MKNKIITVIITVPFAELILSLIQKSDSITDFIPFFQTLQGGRFHLSAYDSFLMLSIFALTIFNRFFNTSPKACMKEIQSIFSRVQALDFAICTGVGIAMHLFICPLLYSLLSDAINVLTNAHDAIRHTTMVTLPFLWLVSIRIANNNMSTPQYPVMPSNQYGMQMMPPP